MTLFLKCILENMGHDSSFFVFLFGINDTVCSARAGS